jgi:cell wall-associated NlpC family hydrolase
MTEGMQAAMARVAQLQALIAGPRSLATTATSPAGRTAGSSTATGSTTSSSSDDFAASLAKALGKTTGAPDKATSRTDLGAKVIDIARQYLGTPYKWGGTDPDKGLDCSGLTQLVYKQVGVKLPRVSRDQAHAGTRVDNLAAAKPGDLLFFDSPVNHVGIYLGENKILDAPKTGDVVRIRKVWEKPSAIRRVLPETSALSPMSAATGAQATSRAGGSGLSGPYASLFTAAGKKHGVDPALLSAVAKAESGYRANAVSKAGAQGLMQLMPSTARGLGVDPKDPAQAIDGAARLLSGYLRDYKGKTDLALAAYNAGPGAVRKYGGVPPYNETRTYVERVTRNWENLR